MYNRKVEWDTNAFLDEKLEMMVYFGRNIIRTK